MPRNNMLRALVDLRDRQIQKARIQFGNRLSAIEREADDASDQQEGLVQRYLDRFAALEEELNDDIAVLVKDDPVYAHVSAVKGIGPGLSAKLIAMIDIARSPTVSSLWRYSGYGQGRYWQDEDGKIVSPERGWQWAKNAKGEKERVHVVADAKPGWQLTECRDRPIEGWCLSYNKRLKTTLWVVAGSFMKAGSPYRQVYDEARIKYDRTHPEWSDGHAHNASLRAMIKRFLSHLWARWRVLEGLPISGPYIDPDGNGRHHTRPEDFGWPPLEPVP